MAKIASDKEQSKKLVDILPIESADMRYDYINATIIDGTPKVGYKHEVTTDCFPAWSLAALLQHLPNEIRTGTGLESRYSIKIRKYDFVEGVTMHQIAYGNSFGLSGSWHDMINSPEREDLVDACVEMIIILKEMNLL